MARVNEWIVKISAEGPVKADSVHTVPDSTLSIGQSKSYLLLGLVYNESKGRLLEAQSSPTPPVPLEL